MRSPPSSARAIIGTTTQDFFRGCCSIIFTSLLS
jgi:hypothetical protein